MTAYIKYLRSLTLCGLVFILLPIESIAATKSSTLASTTDGDRVLVVNTDSNTVSFLNVAGFAFLESEVPVGREPQTIAIDHMLSYAYVVNRGDNSLSVIDIESVSTIAIIPVEDSPFGVLANDRYIFVSNQGAHSISVIHKETFLPLLTIPTAEAPKGLAMTDDGSRLYVTHFFSGSISVIDTDRMQLLREINVSSMANISQSIVLDEKNARAYLPQTFSNTSNMALLFDTTVAPVVSIIDMERYNNLRSARLSLDVIDRPVGIPIDAVLSDSDILYVVNAASNDLSVIDLTNRKAIAHIELGDNPRGIALSADGSTVFVNNSLSGTVSIIDASTPKLLREVVVTNLPLNSSVLNGKKLFNSSDSPDIARDQWIACASCHFDGGHDGRTWVFSDGPRNTPSLLGVAETLPIHWSGDLDELHDVETAVRGIQGGHGLISGSDNCSPSCDKGQPNAGRSRAMDDLVSYMSSLHISSDTQHGLLEESGRLLFNSNETGCASCHIPPLYTDNLRHYVGTGKSELEQKGLVFNTPSLRGIRLTPPYLHDGSAKSLRDLLTSQNKTDQHGKTSQLSTGEILSLEKFLLGLSLNHSENRVLCCSTSEVVYTSAEQPTMALEMVLNSMEFKAGDVFKLNLHAAGLGTVDIYAAIQFPDSSFITLSADRSVSNFNNVMVLAKDLTLNHSLVFELAQTELPVGLPDGNYIAYAIAVNPGANVLDESTWVSFDTLSFVLRP